jgi:hypothetical protein
MSEHQWEGGVGYKSGCVAAGDTPTEWLQHCATCGIGALFPLPAGEDPKRFVMGPYSPWDGKSTCEDILARREREAAEGAARWEAAKRERRADRPRREAFLGRLNALCAEHGCHLSEHDGEMTVALEPKAYALLDDDVTVVER